MKRFSEQLYKKSQTVKLKAAERRELRARITSYMEYHPLPGANTKKVAAIQSPYYTERFIRVSLAPFLKVGTFAAVFMILVIPALAERAVPGDGLYAIKVSFNEEVRSTFAFTPYQKIEWETERVNRRIAEARLLASEGRLTNEVEEEVAAAVKSHAENAKREIAALRTEDAEEATLASIELSTTLAIQAASLDDEDTTNEERPTKLLATVVKEAATAEAVANPGVPSYDRLMARVETNTTRVQELLTSLRLSDDSSDYQDINRRISDIERTVTEAMNGQETSEEESRLLLVDALQRTQRLIVFMNEIRTSQEFEVEDFVPVVLTPEEQTVRIAEMRVATEAQVRRIDASLSTVINPDIREKVTFTLETLLELQTQIMNGTDYQEIKAQYDTFTNLAGDITKIIDVPQNQPLDPPEEPVAPLATSSATTTDEVEPGAESNEPAEAETADSE
jgi:hypothetical protein